MPDADVKAITWPVIPTIPATVKTGDKITSVYTNQQHQCFADLWTDLQAVGAVSIADPTSNKGDLLVRSATALTRLGVGTDGQMLRANAAHPLGMNWATVDANSLGVVPVTRRVNTSGGLLGGGPLSADLTLTVDVNNLGLVPVTRRVIAGTGMSGGGPLSGDVTLNVALTASDITAAGGVPATRKLTAGTGLTAGSGGDLSADRTFAVAPDSTLQRINIAKNGAIVTTIQPRSQLNFIEGANITMQITEKTVENRVDVTVNAVASGGATPTNFWVNTSPVGTRTTLNLIAGANTTISGTDVVDAVLGNRVDVTISSAAGGQNQTPWTTDIDAAGHNLNNANTITGQSNLALNAPTSVNINGLVRAMTGSGNVLVGTSVDDGNNRLQVSGGIAGKSLTLSGAPGVNHPVLSYQISGKLRWALGANADTVVWALNRYDANGNSLDSPISVNPDGNVYLSASIQSAWDIRANGAFYGNLSGNASSASSVPWSGVSSKPAWNSDKSQFIGGANVLNWRAYPTSHVIFDASSGYAPDGTSGVSKRDPAAEWADTYPTLMGWNGGSTYGVRVSSSRNSDNTTYFQGRTCAGDGAYPNPWDVIVNASNNWVYMNGIQYNRGEYNPGIAHFAIFAGGDNGMHKASLAHVNNSISPNWGNVQGRPTDLGSFSNGPGYALRNDTVNHQVTQGALSGFSCGTAIAGNQYGALYWDPADASINIYHSGLGFVIKIKKDTGGICEYYMSYMRGDPGPAGRLYRSGNTLMIS